jgi:hypothetical protein
VLPSIDYYRVQVVYPWHARSARRRVRPVRPWARTWQAEWDGALCAPRAYTRWGIERRAPRWQARGGRPRWHRFIRRHLTHRHAGINGGPYRSDLP